MKKRILERPISALLALVLALGLLPSFSLTASAAPDEVISSSSVSPLADPTGGITPLADPAGFRDLVISLGSNESELRFTWYTNQSTGSIAIREMGEVNWNVISDPDPNLQHKSSDNAYSHKATVTGLNPSTTYQYKLIGSDNSVTDVYTVTTGNPANFSFIAVGDPQIGSANYQTDGTNWRKTVTTATSSAAISFMASFGDQVDNMGGLNAGTVTQQYTQFFTPTELENLPTSATMGNHESSTSNGKQLHSDHYNPPNKTFIGAQANNNFDYWYRYGNALFIVLDANVNSAVSHQSFISSAISANPGVRWKVIEMHQSLYSDGMHLNGQMTRSDWYTMIDNFGIDVVLAGHDHHYTRTFQMLGGQPQKSQKWLDANNIIQSDLTGMQYKRVYMPTGTLYMTFNSSSGSKYYGANNNNPQSYSAVHRQLNTPEFSVINVTNDYFTIMAYRSDTLELLDNYTIYKELPATNKSDLEDAIDDAQTLISSDYISTTWNALATALTNAITVDEDNNATQQQVDNALAALITARANLVTRGSGTPVSRTTHIGFKDNWYFYGLTNSSHPANAFDMDNLSSWLEKPAPIGYGTVPSGIAPWGYEIPTGSGPFEQGASNRYSRTYFKKSFELSPDYVPGSVTGLTGTHWIDDSVIIYVNGIEVYRYNTDTTAQNVSIGATTNLSSYGGQQLQTCGSINFTIGSYNGHNAGTSGGSTVYDAASLANLQSALHPGTNVITCVVGQGSASSSDICFDISLDMNYQVEYVSVADKTALGQTIATADALNSNLYTTQSWLVFAEVLTAAKVVYADPDASQALVNQAVTTLSDAIISLVLRPVPIFEHATTVEADSQYVIVAKVGDNYYALKNTTVTYTSGGTSNTTLAAAQVTVNGNLVQASSVDAPTMVWTAAAGSSSGKFTFNNGGYLARNSSSGNFNLVLISPATSYADWTYSNQRLNMATTNDNYNLVYNSATNAYFNVVSAGNNNPPAGSEIHLYKLVEGPTITITAQPAATTNVTFGNISASLSVTATVTPPAQLTYQWYSATNVNGAGGASISGATSASFAIPTGSAVGTYYYYCIVSSAGAQSVTSDVATVVVDPAPIPVITIITQPIESSGSLSLVASVTQNATLIYQWYSNSSNNTNGTIINEATSASYGVPTNLTPGTYYYYCVINASGPTGNAVPVTSNVVTVTVTSQPSVIYQEVSSITVPGDYVIVAKVTNNNIITYYALTNATRNSSLAAEAVTISGNTVVTSSVNAATMVWTAGATGSKFTFNNSGYLTRTTTSGSTTLLVAPQADSNLSAWSYASQRLSVSSTSTTYYLQYNAGSGGYFNVNSNSGNASEIHLYKRIVVGDPEITIDTQPASVTNVTQGNISGILSIAASVNTGATPNYQWYESQTNTNTGGTAQSGTGATTANFTIPTGLTQGTYNYYCVVSFAGATSKTSNVATVVVGAPDQTRYEEVSSITVPGDYVIVAKVTNNNISTYYALTNATRNSSLAAEAVTISGNTVVTSSVNAATMVWTAASVSGSSTRFTFNNGGFLTRNGNNLEKTSQVSGTGYSAWEFANQRMGIQSSSSSNNYYLLFNSAGYFGVTSTSSSASEIHIYKKITGIPLIVINTQPATPVNVTQGSISGNLTVAASVTDDAVLSYQWFKSETESDSGGVAESGTGAATASLSIPTGLTPGNHYFYCVVSATGGAASVTTCVVTVVVAAQQFTVSFNANGGTPTPENQLIASNGKVVKPQTDPTRDGYTFLFWSQDGTTRYYFDTPVLSSFTLYAKWEKDTEDLEPITQQVVNAGTNWWYYGRTNANFFDESTSMAFTANWTNAKTPIGYGPAPTGMVYGYTIPAGTGPNGTGDAGSSAQNRFTRTYFKTTFSFDPEYDIDEILSLSGTHWTDDSLIVYINGVEVYRYNTSRTPNEVAVGFNTSWGSYGGSAIDKAEAVSFTIDSEVVGHFLFNGIYGAEQPVCEAYSLYNLKQAIVPGANVITCVVGQWQNDSSDLVFDLDFAITYQPKTVVPPPTHTVTFIDVEQHVFATQTVDHGAKATAPSPGPIREDYNFIGWFLGENENSYDFNASVNDDIILYAHWESTDVYYTVTFYVDGVVFNTQQVKRGQTPQLPGSPIKTGSIFLGWYERVSGTPYLATPVYSDLDIDSRWQTVRLSVRFNPDNGDPIETIFVDYNQTVAAPEEPVKEGYNFAGWYDGQNAFDFATPITSDKLLTAKWAIKTFIVSFDPNNGSSVVEISVDYNQTVVAPATPTKVGYIFAGWFNGEAEFVPDMLVTDDLVFIAKWNIETFTVSFNSTGGTAVSSQTVDYNQLATRPTNPTRAGYDFAGWLLNSAEYDFATPVTKSFELTAVWKAIYTVTFVFDNGILEPAVAYVSDGDQVAEPVEPVRSGYKFRGWYLDNTLFDFNTAITGNTVLTAHWEMNFLYGDVNNDGRVNAIDVTLLARYIARDPSVVINLRAADVNDDGRVNSFDVTILERFVAKQVGYEKLPHTN